MTSPALPPSINEAWMELLSKSSKPLLPGLEQVLHFCYLQGIQYALDRLIPSNNHNNNETTYTKLMVELLEETLIPEE